MPSPYLDTLMGIQEGGSSGAGMLAMLKAAGIKTGPYAPWIIPASIGTNILGKFLGSEADEPIEKMNMRLGNQQLEIGSLNIAAEKKRQAKERADQLKQKAFQTSLSGIFGEYSRLKGGQ